MRKYFDTHMLQLYLIDIGAVIFGNIIFTIIGHPASWQETIWIIVVFILWDAMKRSRGIE